MLANYFTNAAFNIADHVSSLTEESHSEHDSQLGAYESIQRKFDFKLVTVVELLQQALEKISSKKYSGWDSGILPKLRRMWLLKGTATLLTNLYNV